ncbi:ArfGap-domain-containing protein [Thozetella sp. PMI_491]|nr:ArfGap-domain-containing protein [Thozetella sp. PMI_491]
MSRRPPNEKAVQAAQNQATIKQLLKLEHNKVCADCKRNKHPRWASWNLGVFICIRCSGIHRGMGTHISRVKSVDLDAWTDEQLQSILSWGNARANKYWEAKLSHGHAPSEAKIENFIRTKYELKRWVMDGPIPDPSTLDADGDDDVPLSVVKEKQNVERRESVRKASVGQTAAPRANVPPPDLIGGDLVPPPRASTAGPTATKVPPKAEAAPPKTTSTKDSLLGLDFLGTEPAAPPRPASTTGTPGAGGQSRPDLKQSILSLYASAPRPQPQQAPQQQSFHAASGSIGGGMPSPGQQSQSSFGGLNDAFSSLSFSSAAGTTSPKQDAFASLGSFSSARPAPQSNASAFSNLSGGGFFDPKPAATSPPAPKQSFDLGGFGSLSPTATTTAAPPRPAAQPASAALGDLFDFSAPSPPAPASQPSISSPPASSSVFNLSNNQPPKSPPAAPAASSTSMGGFGSLGGGTDVWGGNAWATPEAPKKTPEVSKPLGGSNDFGWGISNQPIVPGASGGFAPAPKVAADEEFGGWTSSTGPAGSSSKPSGGLGGGDDLFSNVWQ